MDERELLENIYNRLINEKPMEHHYLIKHAYTLLSDDEVIRVHKSLGIPRDINISVILFHCDNWWVWLSNGKPVQRIFIEINWSGEQLSKRVNYYKFWRRILRAVDHPIELLEMIILTYF